MKNKITRVFGLLICLMVFPLIVHADVGMPDIKPYDVVVTKVEGIKLEDSYDKTSVVIPYDTKVTVNMEYYNSGDKKYYGYVEYEGVSGEIDLSEVKIANEKVDLTKYDKLDEPYKVYAIHDIEMYKGPSQLYGKVDGGKIPKGATISYEYYDEVWALVNYEGKEGWIIRYPFGKLYGELQSSIASFAPKGKNKVMFIDDVNSLFVDPTSDETIPVRIPKGAVVEYEYSYASLKSEYLYIDYDGTKGWIYVTYFMGPYTSEGVVESQCETGIVISDDVYIYSEVDELNSKTNKKVSKGTEFNIMYSYEKEGAAWYYISYEDTEGWIAVDSSYQEDYKDSIVDNYGTINIYKAKENVDVYEYPEKDAKKVYSLKSGAEVKSYYVYTNYELDSKDEYANWYYIKDGDVAGWVLVSNFEYVSNANECSAVNTRVITSEDDEDDTEEENDKKGNIFKNLTPAQMAIVGVSGAVVLALVVIVIIAIVNKKKKNKNVIEELK